MYGNLPDRWLQETLATSIRYSIPVEPLGDGGYVFWDILETILELHHLWHSLKNSVNSVLLYQVCLELCFRKTTVLSKAG